MHIMYVCRIISPQNTIMRLSAGKQVYSHNTQEAKAGGSSIQGSHWLQETITKAKQNKTSYMLTYSIIEMNFDMLC